MSFSLPGLGLTDDPSPSDPSNQTTQTTSYTLPATSEWRFEVPAEKSIQLKLLTGTAELFGTELVVGNATPYTFAGMKGAVYTWTGCSFEVTGEGGGLQSEYTAEEAGAGMKEVVNLHFALEGLRDSATQAARHGPRVLILGPQNAGKTSLSKMLVAYAIRSGRAPVVANLDAVGEGVLSLPGTLSAGVFKSLVDVEEGWGSAPMSGPSGSVPVKMPLVYYFGIENVEGEKAGKVYMGLVRRLALAVQGRMQGDAEASTAGVVIDTPGVLGGVGGSGSWEIVQHVISEFAVNCVVCLGSERLYSEATKRFDGKPSSSSYGRAGDYEAIQVIKLAKSGGCVDRDEAFMQARRTAQIKTYFYGALKGVGGVSLSPRQQHVDFNTLSVYRVVGTKNLGVGDEEDDEEFLPGGADQDYDNAGSGSSRIQLPSTQLLETITTPHLAMQNSLLTIMNCEPDAPEEEIRFASVMGFLYVTDVDVVRGRLGVLSPVAGRVPSRAMLWGEWPEGVLGMVGW